MSLFYRKPLEEVVQQAHHESLEYLRVFRHIECWSTPFALPKMSGSSDGLEGLSL